LRDQNRGKAFRRREPGCADQSDLIRATSKTGHARLAAAKDPIDPKTQYRSRGAKAIARRRESAGRASGNLCQHGSRVEGPLEISAWILRRGTGARKFSASPFKEKIQPEPGWQDAFARVPMGNRRRAPRFQRMGHGVTLAKLTAGTRRCKVMFIFIVRDERAPTLSFNVPTIPGRRIIAGRANSRLRQRR